MALVNTITDLIWNLKKAVAATGFAIKTSATEAPGSSPSITSGSAAPSATEPNGSLYLRTGGAIGTALYRRISSAWVADSDFGTAGITADVIAEKTAANGVAIDGLTIRDSSVRMATVADPGNAGAIPVTTSAYCPLVTAGAETRTLAAPSFIGQELLLYLKTDGGDCVVTCATTINEAGNNTITFDNTGEALRLIAVEEGVNLRWRCAVADGAGLTTV